MRNTLRWFAVVEKRAKLGYVVDYYPEEKRAYERDYGVAIIGDFATPEEAEEAVTKRLQEMMT